MINEMTIYLNQGIKSFLKAKILQEIAEEKYQITVSQILLS